jgi:hypothetical protein
MAAHFSPEERADLLLDLLHSPAGRHSDKGKQWSLELFSISTKQLRPGHYRASMQKNALTALSRIDPQRAAQLYTTQDTPDMWNQTVSTEDYRAFGTRTLFPNLWSQSGVSAVPTMRRIADWIGSTGEYPYAAMADIANKVVQDNKPLAEDLVSDAISSFKSNKGFLDKDQEFTSFILAIQKTVRSSLVRDAIEAELASLEAAERDENVARFSIQAADSQHTVQFKNQAEYIAYRLLPIVNQMDPAWAEEVKDKYSILHYLPQAPQTGSVRVTGAVTLPGESVSNSDVISAMDNHRLLQVQMLAQNDPKQAAEIAQQIQDSGSRAVALATLVPSFVKLDQQKAGDWFKGANDELERVPPGRTRLKLMVALVGDLLATGRMEQATAMFDKAFDYGEELFEQDLKANPGKMAYQADGEEELAQLTEKFTEDERVRSFAVARVDGIREELLKAKLLIAAVNGLSGRAGATA